MRNILNKKICTHAENEIKNMAQKRGERIVALDEIMKLMCATLLPRLNRIKMRIVNKLKKEVK